MRSTLALCQDGQWMRWRHLPGGDTDKNDISYSTSDICKKQFHFRGWDDYEHSKGTGHVRGEWVVGGIHHENRGLLKLGHDIDRPWDLVRYQAVKSMRRHCSYGRWRFHMSAAREHQEFSGLLRSAPLLPRQAAGGSESAAGCRR